MLAKETSDCKENVDMKKNILQYLECNAIQYPDKTIFASENTAVSYAEFTASAKKVGSSLLKKSLHKANIAVFVDKSVSCLLAMMGVVYAGSCYTVIDVQSPTDRINTILDTFHPSCILTDKKNVTKCSKITGIMTLTLEQMLEEEADEALLSMARKVQVDTDPLYVLFTSGSTGIPKGSVICHRSVIDYAETICKTFNIDETTVWGSQTPFYFSMSILDVFSTICAGATLYIIPKMYFSFPVLLIEFLNEKKINSIYWVPTAMNIVADFDTFSEAVPNYLTKVLFAGEVMPVKQLNYWMDHLPKVLFANLFGPTEITDTCTYYIVNRRFNNNESLPIGIPFDNCDVLVLNEDYQLVRKPEDGRGELFVRGSFLGMGYYNNSQKTAEAFVQNPLNTAYPELLYKTGDIVAYNEYGELIYFGRKDHQIKHLGHRIELGEIETAVSSIEGVTRACCVYDNTQLRIVLFYSGNAEPDNVLDRVKTAVPKYMVPQEAIKLNALPMNMNGKIDRVKLVGFLHENK